MTDQKPKVSNDDLDVLTGEALNRHWVWATTPGLKTEADLEVELERRRQGANRLQERFGSIPAFAQKAASDPDYWNKLYGSQATT